MESYDLYEEILQKQKQLDIAVKSLRKTGTDYAAADRDYYMIKTQEALKLKESGNAISFVSTIVKGIKPVAEARFKLNVASAMYDANKESINVLKIEIKVLNSQLEREWGQANRE